MKTNNAMEDYIHLRANYWILTSLCGIFLGLFILSLLNVWGIAYLIAYGSLFGTCAFYALELSVRKKSSEWEIKNISR